jgi:AraC-like DNA-binding protein
MVDNLQRVGFLVVVPSLLREFGIDPESVLAAVRLEPAALEDPEGVIPYSAMGRLIEACAIRSGCHHFGLLVGQRAGTLSLGLIGDLMRHAPTLGVAFRDLVRHQHRHSHGSVVYLLDHGDSVLFGYAILQRDIAGAVQIYDGSMAIAFSIIRRAVGNAKSDDLTVFLSRPKPPDLEPYRRFFGASMQFDSEHTGVLVPRSWMDLPVAGADPLLRRTLEKGANSYLRAGDYDFVTRIRRTLAEGLMTGEIGGDAVARLLGVSLRTLRRRLDDHRTSFQEMLDETRLESAKQLLSNTDLGIGQIGLVLRYSDPSVFTRAFTRWSGLRPSEWRMQARSPNRTD